MSYHMHITCMSHDLCRYMYHYISEDDVVYLCITDDVSYIIDM